MTDPFWFISVKNAPTETRYGTIEPMQNRRNKSFKFSPKRVTCMAKSLEKVSNCKRTTLKSLKGL